MQHQQTNGQIPAIIELQSIDSTNNYALSLLNTTRLTERQETIGHGSCVFAHEQWAGKGQRGKKWKAEKGQNIQMSLVLNPLGTVLGQQFLLSATVAVAVRQFFEKYAQSDIRIKWPNDIYFQDRKAGGILIENIVSGSTWRWAVVGIGLNINQADFDPELPNPVSLRQITGKNFDCLALATELRDNILQYFDQWLAEPLSAERIAALMKIYNEGLYKREEKTRLKKDNRVFEALIKDVTPDGQLWVRHAIEESYGFGEVEWVIGKP
ncbi:MAG: biotin--[acetyl-CoA-carboxylase] ligase [Niabella sp.]